MMLNKKGFTLIELMIVVAIIGILAAVAIPGFMRYIKASKTTEAETNLKAIADGAISYFQAEHAANNEGTNMYTKSYPGCEAGSKAPEACDGSTLGKEPSAATVGVKTTIEDTALKEQPWVRLKFGISKPCYYYYSYGSKLGSATIGGVTVIDSFSAGATAALSNATDNENGLDSAFQIIGTAAGAVGAIVDVSDSATATKVTNEKGLTGG